MRTLQEIRDYCNAAKEGPWYYNTRSWCVLDSNDDVIFDRISGGEGSGIFCANAREDLPRVLEDAVRLRQAVLRFLQPYGEYSTLRQALLTDTAYLEDR